MTLSDFITTNKSELLGYIERYMLRNKMSFTQEDRDTSKFTEQDVVRWIMNDNTLYRWALSSGVECI